LAGRRQRRRPAVDLAVVPPSTEHGSAVERPATKSPIGRPILPSRKPILPSRKPILAAPRPFGGGYDDRVGAPRTPFLSARRVRGLDVTVAVWVVFWIVVGVLAAVEIAHLGALGDTVVRTADGLQKTADTLSGLSSIPLIGGSLGDAVKQVDATAATVTSQVAADKTTVRHLSLIVGIALAVGQAALGLLLYLPLRLPWRREVDDVRRALAADRNDPALCRYLARRALEGMSFAQVRARGGDPWREMQTGDPWPLAELELQRLGLRR
jgi:hypothetical protein